MSITLSQNTLKDPRVMVGGAVIFVIFFWLACRSGTPSNQLTAKSSPATTVDPAVYVDAIRSVIAQDRALGSHTTKNLSLWETVAGYNTATLDQIVAKMRAINIDRCPADFRKAYQTHINAWADYAAAARSQGSTSQAEKYVEVTWYEVHRTAQEYGVTDAIQ